MNQRLYDIRNDQDHQIYIKLSRELETAATYNTKGDAFIKWYKDSGESKYLDSSYLNYKNAYQTIKTIPDFSGYSRTLYYLRMANLSLLKKRYSYALSLYNKCEKDSLFMSKNPSKEAVWVGKAEIYTNLKKTDSAFYYINRLYKKDKTKQFSSENLLKIYHLLSINYENTGDSKMAYKFAKQSLSEIDKIKSQNISGNLLLGRHEQQEIQSFSEEMLRKDKRKVILLATLFILFVVIAFVKIYRAYKKKKKLISEYEIKLLHSEKNTGSYIDIEKRLIIRILSKLDQLERKKKFLSNDFKLTTIAKELNTNTAYLSQIINEYKKTSFSDYVHDLRIDYVVKELHKNSVFRNYTIQT
ncbi:hypothetical protein AB4Y90_12025, partial [Chryseobacterium sp. 2TAF14]|uniref:hypothetical protein n=1 Tax=Chryseobacterium sp. 2TAF14 TaxID=3233007 RepID=UPI003F9033B8